MVTITPLSKTNSLYYERHFALKCLLIVYKTLHILFGLDFGFIKFNCFGIKLAPKIITAIPSFFFCVFAGLDFFRAEVLLYYAICYFILHIQYFMCALMLNLIKDDSTFLNLYQDLRIIDLGLKVDHAFYNLEVKLLLSILACLCLRIIIAIGHCTYLTFCVTSDWRHVMYLHTLFGLIVILITCSFMFFAINSRLKNLVSLLKAENSDFLSIQYLYKSIVDIAEKHKAAFDPVVSRYLG